MPPPPSSVVASPSLRLRGVRVLTFGPLPSPLLAELSEAGDEVEAAPTATAGGDGATAELAAALRAAEQALTGEEIACAVVTGAGDDALGAALAAVKLGVPTVWLPAADAPPQALLIGRVADLTVVATDDAAEMADSIRSLAASKLGSP